MRVVVVEEQSLELYPVEEAVVLNYHPEKETVMNWNCLVKVV